MTIRNHITIEQFSSFADSNYYSAKYYPCDENCADRIEFGTLDVGPFSIGVFEGTGIVTKRGWQEIRSSISNLYVLWFPEEGGLSVVQGCSESAKVSPGDMIITSGDKPFNVVMVGDNIELMRVFHAAVPMHILRSSIPEIDTYCGRVIHGTPNLIAAREMILSILNAGEGRRDDRYYDLVRWAVDTAVSSIPDQLPDMSRVHSTKSEAHHRVIQIIDNNLHRHDLNAEFIYNTAGISRRTFCYIMADYGGYKNFVTSRRFDVIEGWLRDGTHADCSLRELYELAGFRDAAHFDGLSERVNGIRTH